MTSRKTIKLPSRKPAAAPARKAVAPLKGTPKQAAKRLAEIAREHEARTAKARKAGKAAVRRDPPGTPHWDDAPVAMSKPARKLLERNGKLAPRAAAKAAPAPARKASRSEWTPPARKASKAVAEWNAAAARGRKLMAAPAPAKARSNGGWGNGPSARSAAPAPAREARKAVNRQRRLDMIHAMLREGCTRADLLNATGWDAISVQQQLRALGYDERYVSEGGDLQTRLVDGERGQMYRIKPGAKPTRR